MRKILISAIRAYQRTLSPDHGVFLSWRGRITCRFYPTCSEYAITAIEKYGVGKGTWLALKRIARCHPWGGAEVDEV